MAACAAGGKCRNGVLKWKEAVIIEIIRIAAAAIRKIELCESMEGFKWIGG